MLKLVSSSVWLAIIHLKWQLTCGCINVDIMTAKTAQSLRTAWKFTIIIFPAIAIILLSDQIPHLALFESTSFWQVPFLFGLTAMEKVATCVIHWIFRRTGRHLFLTDEDEGKPPLLCRMVEDSSDYPFMYDTLICTHPCFSCLYLGCNSQSFQSWNVDSPNGCQLSPFFPFAGLH